MTATIVKRAYAPHQPTWQRFHEFAAPLASSSGAGAAAASSVGHHPYAKQYSHVYAARLAMLRDRCLANAKQCIEEEGLCKDGEAPEIADKIIEVSEGKWSILVGTIVKEVDPKRRPPVETTYGAAADAQSFLFPGKDGKPQESLRAFLFDSEKGDVLHLEDESGRVELAPEETAGGAAPHKHALDPNAVATGVVAAVVGKVDGAKGIMRVHSVHFAGPGASEDGASKAKLELRGATSDEEPMLLLVSGLECGGDSPDDAETGASLALRREMLLEYLTDPSTNGSSICRVIVAGGGVEPPPPPKEEEEVAPSNGKGKKNYNSVWNAKKDSKNDAAARAATAMRELDLYLSEILSAGIPVDYLPGMHDPTNANWPQRPVHSCLLPMSCEFVDLFGRGTNPYEGVLGGAAKEEGVTVLGSDGLNIADLRRFLAKPGSSEKKEEDEGEVAASAASCMDALNQTLKYAHVAPTGPDSLPTFPSQDEDPFVLRRRPDVYFAGNCDAVETRLVDEMGEAMDEDDAEEKEGTRLVCVPSFAQTGEAVLVKLKSLECEVLSFNDATL
ncbi:hypothetical protein ACHAXT_007154 [Thalassiosira profunda]